MMGSPLMKNMPKLSVIIPTRDTRELTLRCLAALWLCDPQPDEVIVVDDGSSDNTAYSVLRKYPRHVMVRLPRNEGFSVAANHGMARASGDLLLLLNSDTELEPLSLGAVFKAFAENPDLGIAGAALKHANGAPQWSGGRRPTPAWCFALASGIPALLGRMPGWRRLRPPSGSGGGRVDWVAGSAMVVRRSVWEEVGPFDLGYRFYCQDLDLCHSAAKAGWKIQILPDFKVLHHHGGTISESGISRSSIITAVRFRSPEVRQDPPIRSSCGPTCCASPANDGDRRERANRPEPCRLGDGCASSGATSRPLWSRRITGVTGRPKPPFTPTP